ncbi:hypothetical protein BG32_01990 [Mesotoga sp. HF07.pep.5.2.highcov]|uniref:polysaccharide pyruvyl transferase family protein n=1 Tax=Mesotoga sp. HF07.pep.5.2.highcov TaxID=1462923 RepID=UPI000FF0C191|nr:polysaccharide pyruvyl transferase family protein [Mesotoga sp. HF07.pep.5.2.highcov]RLL88082.1 hypothetical protein BG32_01990 [Mesotoga sp. HF07.pep.5.2.highcov]
MKILIRHIPNTLNYGSAMMAENLIFYLRSLVNSSCEFYCDFSTENDLNRMELATGISPLRIDEIPVLKPSKGNKIVKAFNLYKRIKNEIIKYREEQIDSILILGGDDLSEYYSGKGIAIELYRLMSLSKSFNTFLLGQTIGPFHSWRVPLAKRYLRGCYVYTRDPLTVDYLKGDLNLSNVKESRDLAWLDLPRQNESRIKSNILGKYSIIEGKYITLVPSGILRQYCSSASEYSNTWTAIVNSLVENESLKAKKIVLLCHVLKPRGADDRNVIAEIEQNLTRKQKERVIPIYDAMLPIEARQILGNGLFTITGRMHAAVSTFQMGKPAISLSYSVKYRGVIGEGLGMKDLVIEARGDDLWESGKIVDLVMDKVDYVLSNYDSLVSRIKPAVEKNKKLAMGQIEDIAARIEEKVV